MLVIDIHKVFGLFLGSCFNDSNELVIEWYSYVLTVWNCAEI